MEPELREQARVLYLFSTYFNIYIESVKVVYYVVTDHFSGRCHAPCIHRIYPSTPIVLSTLFSRTLLIFATVPW